MKVKLCKCSWSQTVHQMITWWDLWSCLGSQQSSAVLQTSRQGAVVVRAQRSYLCSQASEGSRNVETERTSFLPPVLHWACQMPHPYHFWKPEGQGQKYPRRKTICLLVFHSFLKYLLSSYSAPSLGIRSRLWESTGGNIGKKFFTSWSWSVGWG